jgi:hypothetical protein
MAPSICAPPPTAAGSDRILSHSAVDAAGIQPLGEPHLINRLYKFPVQPVPPRNGEGRNRAFDRTAAPSEAARFLNRPSSQRDSPLDGWDSGEFCYEIQDLASDGGWL